MRPDGFTALVLAIGSLCFAAGALLWILIVHFEIEPTDEKSD